MPTRREMTLMLAAAAAASADSLQLVNGGNYTMGGVYVGPYNFTGNIGGQNVNLKLICDDFASDVSSGESWSVNISTFPSLSGVKFIPPDSLTQYEQVAYLVEQMFALNPSAPGYAQALGDLQWAVWNIFDPSLNDGANDPYGTISAADQANIANLVASAVANGPNGNYSNLMVYTPVAGTQVPSSDGTPQEYFGDAPLTAPEPGVVLLLGTGLTALILFRRRLAL